MYSLEIIKSAAFQTPRPPEPGTTTRRCSFHATRAGIILHSARHRSTLFLSAESPDHAATLRSLRRRGPDGRDRLIESFF